MKNVFMINKETKLFNCPSIYLHKNINFFKASQFKRKFNFICSLDLGGKNMMMLKLKIGMNTKMNQTG